MLLGILAEREVEAAGVREFVSIGRLVQFCHKGGFNGTHHILVQPRV